METLLLIAGSMVFLAGGLTIGFASCLDSRLIDEINKRSPADQQVDTFRITEAILKRHQQVCPDSAIRRRKIVAAVAGVLMMFAGLCLLLDYGSLHDLNRNREVAPRQRTTMGSVTAGPVGRNSYRYTFTVSDLEYSAWGTMQERELKIEQPVLVYYDPENPAINALAGFEYSNSQRAWDLVLGFVILLFVTVLIPVCMIVARD